MRFFQKNILLCTALFFLLFVACDDGCPEGTHSYQGDCVEDGKNTGPSENQDDHVIIPKTNSDIGNYGKAPVDAPEEENNQSLDAIEVPNSAMSFLVWIEGNNPTGYVLPWHIYNSRGQVIYDLEADLTTDDWINNQYHFHYYYSYQTSLFIPNTPKITMEPGTWRADLFLYHVADSPRVTIYFKSKRPESFEHNRLNLNIWFTALDNLNADNAEEDASLQTSISTLKELYKTANVDVEEIQFYDVPKDLAQRCSVIDDYNEFYDLLRATSAAENNWPNLFLVRDYDSEFERGIVGLSSHIPGPPGKQGSPFAGVTVAYPYFEDLPRLGGAVMAHEMGHWLGLFHTTESIGKLFDPLDDTEECSISKDHNGDKVVAWDECGTMGRGNLMFWLIPENEDFSIGEGGISFSPNQQWVMERHPSVQFVP